MIKKILIGLVLLILFFLALLYFKVIWVLAPHYDLKTKSVLETPIMDMEAYKEIWETHRRPYIYTLATATGGAVRIVGVEHVTNSSHSDLDSIRHHWKKFQPDIALVEGRVGNLITWFQDPAEELGEGGLVTQLANENGIELYSWESKREDEIKSLLENFSAEEIAMFYTFRPYFGNLRYGKYDDEEAALQDYLESRTDYTGIRGVFTSWQELDQKWQKDFPDINWRTFRSGSGYPEGYLNDIWNRTNLQRDEHMVMSVVELVKEGRRVFVTMGVSHAPRIEQTLKTALQ